MTSMLINPDNDRLLFTEPVQTLQQMASFKVASTLWMNVMLSGKYHTYKDTLQNAVQKTAPVAVKLIKQLKITRPAKEKIVRSSCAMRIELELWMIYHREHLLPGRKITLYTCHLKCCVWKSNGDIDFKESARKMISMKYFGDRENFEIMSKFCMQDDLNKLKIDDTFVKIGEKLSFSKTPIAFYWHCKLTNEMSKIPSDVFHFRGDHSLGSFMITLQEVDNWHPMEYFFNLLTEQEQVRKTIELLENPNSHAHLKRLFWKMNESVRNQLLSQIPVEIVMIFLTQFNDPTSAFYVWMHIKDTMTADQFCDLFTKLFRQLNNKMSTCTAECIPLAKKIWNTADDSFKRKFADDGVNLRFLLFRSSLLREFDPDLEFQSGLLSFAKRDFRRTLILEMGDSLFAVDDFSRIDQLLKLCLPNPKDMTKFKKGLPTSFYIEERTEKAFTNGEFVYLNQFFDRYFPSKAKIVEFKKDYLETFRKNCNASIFDPAVWSEFENFVNTTSSDVSYRNSTKKNFIRKFELKYFRDKSNIAQLDLMETLVARFLTDEQTAKLKKKLLQDVDNHLRYFVEQYLLRDNKFFDGNFLRRLVAWCSTDAESLAEFKRRIPVDNLFSKSLSALLRLIRQDDGGANMIAVFARQEDIDFGKFLNVDNFLKLWFNDDEAVKKYKLGKIFDFENKQFFQDLAETAKIDEHDVKTFLIWGLADDQEQICKFKADCKDETIVNVL